MNPQPLPGALSQHYRVRDTERLIELYSRIAATPSVRLLCQQRLDWLEALMPERGRLLDFACADGFFFEQAQKRGWDAHGVDCGEWTKDAAKARGLNNLHVGDLANLGFPDHHFDVVYAAQVFEHLTDPKADLRQLYRILRPGGLLYIDVPNYRTLPILFGRDDFVLNAPPQHVNYFTPRTLRLLLESHNFTDVRMTSTDGLKWEMLLGRRTRSDIQDVYRSNQSEHSQTGRSKPESAPAEDARNSRIKGFVRAALVRPLLYRGLKIGMTLSAYARRS
jgi:SAM-dependent methyltransferase